MKALGGSYVSPECSNAGILAMDWPMLSLLCGETGTEAAANLWPGGLSIWSRGQCSPDFIRFPVSKRGFEERATTT